MLLHSDVAGTGRPIVVLPSLGLDHSAMRLAVEPAFRGAAERPASFVCGRRDRIAGYRNVCENLVRFPRADYLLASEAGHFLPAEQPDLLEGAVRCWLRRCA